MSIPPPSDHAPPPQDGIDEGKRLIRVGGDIGLSLADRIAERLQRLTWRTPLHDLRLRGRYPLKLIAVTDDPFAGDVARGRALVEGTLMFRGERLALETLDLAKLDVSAPLAEYLNSFAWLRDLSTVAARAQGAPVAERLMRMWLAQHADTVSDPAWRPDILGRRIMFWIAHAPLILSSADLIYRSKVLNTLARGARHLDRSADKAAPGPRRMAAWSGVVTAGLLIPGGDPRRSFGEAGLARAINASLSSDGGVVSRSPLGQVDALMTLTMLRAAYAARRSDPPPSLEEALTRMVPPLLAVCHGDRATGSWQGGGPISASMVDAVVGATNVRTRPLRQPREWGYQRIVAGSTLLVMDAAPPPIARMVEGGCASTLAFELSDGPSRLVVNCGGARTANVALPAALMEGLRTTAAHSTLTVGDSNSTALLRDGVLGRGVSEVELVRQETESVSRIEASHDGYVRRFGFAHRRAISVGLDGRDVRGEDMLLPSGRRRAAPGTAFALRFHLAPSVEVSPTPDGLAAMLRMPNDVLWQFRCRGAMLEVEESVWIDADGRPHPTEQLVVTGTAPAGGINVSWWFHRTK